MKVLFYFSLVLLILFEIAKVYFIMPMPGSQRMESIDLAYFLYNNRWLFRIGLGLICLLGLWRSKFKSVWLPLTIGLIGAFVMYLFNFKMTADHMFIQPKLVMEDSKNNQVATKRIVLGVSYNGEASAYPIQYLAYHHQVRDVVGGQPVMVTYCNVCRTGRVFEPKINGQNEVFRLVGMDHFNAMFEDSKTKSWWRQENGQAIAGPLKGSVLPELACSQVSLEQWLQYHPNSKIMQPDSTFSEEYGYQKNYEMGNKKGDLTRTDTLSWKDKSWVIGIQIGGTSKAFDWNELKAKKVLNVEVGATPVVIALAKDGKGFVAFERPTAASFELKNDTLKLGDLHYNWLGKAINPGGKDLKKINAYQEFWHSWRAFHGDSN